MEDCEKGRWEKLERAQKKLDVKLDRLVLQFSDSEEFTVVKDCNIHVDNTLKAANMDETLPHT